MAVARIAEQIVCTMPAEVGLLADIAETIGNAGVNILAILAYEDEGTGEFMFITDDNAVAAAAIRSLGGKVSEETVVAVDMPNEPGTLARAARAVASAGVNVLYAYGTTGPGDSATVYLNTADNEAARAALG